MTAQTKINLVDGAYIYQRAGSKKGTWHLYAYVGGEEVRKSLGVSDSDQAEKLGRGIVKEAQQRYDEGKSVRQYYFAEVANRFLAEEVWTVDRWMKLGLKKKEVEKRKMITQRVGDYLIPYFGKHIGKVAMDKITDKHIRLYEKWRSEQRAVAFTEKLNTAQKRYDDAVERWKASARLQSLYPDMQSYLPKISTGNMKEVVSSTALNTEYSVLKKIFDYAVDNDFVSGKNLPDIKYAKITTQETRLGFTEGEIVLIRETARRRFKEAQAVAVDAYMRRISDEISPELLPHARARAKSGGGGWVGDRTAYGRFTLMCVIDILLGTGMRPDTLAGIERWQVRGKDNPLAPGVANRIPGVHNPSEELPKYVFTGETTKGGKRRKWSIIPDRIALPAIRMLLSHISHEPNAKLLDITTHAVNNSFKKVLADCNLSVSPDGTPHSLYDLRHYYITKKLLEGKINLPELAMNTMTSMQMIEKHYNHMKTEIMYDQISS